MNREDIIRMARQADEGFETDTFHEESLVGMDAIERFAALVAAAEREACATFLEHGVDLGGLAKHPGWQQYTADLLTGCAAAMRARSNP